MLSSLGDGAPAARTTVAIDGGKSGVRVAVSGAHGTAYGESAGTFSDDKSGIDAILGAVAAALARCGSLGEPVAACAGLTGYPDEPSARDRLRRGLARVTGATTVILVEDCVTAHAGALGSAGTVVSAGTGTVVLAVGATSGVARRDGWGPLLGDRGSGFAIGRAGLQAAWRAADGAGPGTRLLDSMRAALGGATLGDAQRFYAAPAPFARVSAFAIAVFEAAREHDEVATAIVHRAVDDLTVSVLSAARAAADAPEVVSYAGRLFDAGEILLEPFSRGLREHGLHVREPAGSALAGAMRIARAATADRPDFDVYGPLIATASSTGDTS